MQVGTMSFSSDHHPHKEYGELFEWDDTTSKLTGSAAAATAPPPPPPEQRSRSPQLRRLSSARRYSEMSMDLCDLQDWLDEEGEDGDDSNNANSRIAYNNYSISTASDHTYNQNQLDCVQETDSDGEDLETDSDDEDDDDGFAGSGEYSNYRGRRCRGVHSSNLKLDGIPDDLQFAATARLEEIQEFETPDNEDYHLLWYTAHELQKMIDGRRVEESIERNNNIVR
ncbi:hypothetical protein FRACYDRAFT_250874 [Fragilariopsis cylindrus CCMP1102]|uniref:Uncharacterized protein n=1 Tax=Fragilariopsis cylindrus CCMP1102 TaxID=635003 RepID=A0A1E7ENB7_9STRA|nr:hypothetical protein FRACYDRAFT_250874 [Fragilariopsis cylindrus CCMP1102]|eukprot:OEU07459.1 hypothetical protein FRACYDRAFT_250874 [Fragilariopsis cylindrus CCMP1102]